MKLSHEGYLRKMLGEEFDPKVDCAVAEWSDALQKQANKSHIPTWVNL